MWILREPSGKVAIVDPSEAAPVTAGLKRLGLAERIAMPANNLIVIFARS